MWVYAGLSRLLPRPAEPTEQVAFTSTLFDVVKYLSGPKTTHEASPSRIEFDGLAAHFKPLDDWADIRYSKWILFSFEDQSRGDALLDELARRECHLFGVNSLSIDGVNSCSAIVCRSNVRKTFRSLTGFVVANLHVLQMKGRSGEDASAFSVTVCNAWLRRGSISKANFYIRARHDFTWRDLEVQWSSMKLADCEAQILDSEERCRLKRAPTLADKCIVAMGRKVLRRKELTQKDVVPSFIRYTDDPRLLELDQFQGLDRLLIHVWDTNNGTILSRPILQWMEQKLYRDRVLVLSGDADMGKSTLARSMLARIADDNHDQESRRPYFIESLTVDGLSAAAKGGWCVANKPILLDEVRPNQARGTRPPMSVDELKKVLTVSEATTIDARFSDIQLSVDQPRIITSNAMNPSDWHRSLPADLYSVMSMQVRLGLDPDAKAVGKRIAWACVSESLIPQSVRDAYARRA